MEDNQKVAALQVGVLTAATLCTHISRAGLEGEGELALRFGKGFCQFAYLF
jgi:hypothetical protein